MFPLLSPLSPLKWGEDCHFSSERKIYSILRYWCSDDQNYFSQHTHHTSWSVGPNQFLCWLWEAVWHLFDCIHSKKCLGSPNYFSITKEVCMVAHWTHSVYLLDGCVLFRWVECPWVFPTWFLPLLSSRWALHLHIVQYSISTSNVSMTIILYGALPHASASH